MSSVVNVCSVEVLNSVAKFDDKFRLEITFEVFEQLFEDLQWELVYVGSAASNAHDQILDSVLVGPVTEGRHRFIFETDGPDQSKIPQSEIVGVTVLLLKGKYTDQEFINIGWFVANQYTDPEMQLEPPATPIIEKLQRRVCTDDVRVTSFAIKWHKEDEAVIENGDKCTVPSADGNSIDVDSVLPATDEASPTLPPDDFDA